MERFFDSLLGEVVSDVQAMHQGIVGLDVKVDPSIVVEGWNFVIGKGQMTVCNEMMVDSPDGRLDFEILRGLSLLSVKYEKEIRLLTLNFSGGVRLRIDLSPEKYNSPEALILTVPGASTLVV